MTAFATSTVCLGGPLPARLEAWHDASGRVIGFNRDDLSGWRDTDIRPALRDTQVLFLEALQDFAGCPPIGSMRGAKRNEAAVILSQALYWGADAILCCASADLRTDRRQITADLSDLGRWADPMGLQVWYEALPWSRWDRSLPAAYARVLEVNRPNVKVVVDTFHHLVCGGDPGYVREIAAADVGLVQLSDLTDDLTQLPGGCYPSAGTVIDVARNHRTLPGEGWMTGGMRQMAGELIDAGYDGAFAGEVRSRALRAAVPLTAATWTMTALGKVVPA